MMNRLLSRIVFGIALIAGTAPASAMLNRQLETFRNAPNNGRQVLTIEGRRYLLMHSAPMGPAKLTLWRTKEGVSDARTLDDFERVATVTMPDETGYGGCLARRGDTLFVAWTGSDGIRVRSASMAADSLRWSPGRTIEEGDCRLGDLFVSGDRVGMAWRRAGGRDRDAIGLSQLTVDGSWRGRLVAEGLEPGFPPVAALDGNGTIHLVWASVAEELYHVKTEGLESEPGPVSGFGHGGCQPSLLSLGRDGMLLACEDQYGFAQSYHFDGERWGGRNRVTIREPLLSSDQLHSPQLARDRHGVVWMFFADNTRRSTFWTRWLGSGWSPVFNGPRIHDTAPRYDSTLVTIGRFSVEKHGAGDVGGIGLVLIGEAPAPRTAYRRQAVPGLPKPGDKCLFLDLLEIARAEGCEASVETARKHGKGPLMELGPPGSFDQDRVFNHGTVLFDEEKEIYRMWYGGIREPRPGEAQVPWWDTIHCGYAESDDGVDWQRVRVGLVEWKGSTDNNIVPGLRHVPLVMRDPAASDTDRRYKGFYFWNSGEHLQMAREGKYDREYDPRDPWFHMSLFPSPDGIRSEPVRGKVHFPENGTKPYSTIPQSVFFDPRETDPAKRYKAYGFMTLNLRRRGTCYLHSPDCVNWTAHPEIPVMDPAIRGMPPAQGGPTGQIHDTVVFPYEGYYLALYQNQREPRHMPVELAVSRDAETFRHVGVGRNVIPVGPPGSWDALTILPTPPVIHEDEIRLYYGGGSEREVDFQPDPHWVAKPGLATLRRDGFTSLRLRDDALRGFVETVPTDPPAEGNVLRLNARCPSPSRIRVAILDASTGRPIPGFAIEDCRPFRGDSLDHTVRWGDRTALSASARPVRLRFELERGKDSEGPVRLFAFWIE
ncbi:MAG: hypothetical protein WD342_01400 [Verrucomicrobiales bacterium]